MVSHVSHSVHVPQGHIYTKGGLDSCEIVGMVSQSIGMVSHVSHSVHVPPKEHIYTKGGPG
jgi:hypothetical protein